MVVTLPMGIRLDVRVIWPRAAGGEAIEDAVFELDQSRIVLGRGRGADVRLPHRAVSIRHATIEQVGTGYTITDHGSTNGTFVGGGRLVPGRPKPLRSGDTIDLGGFSIRFAAGVAVAASVQARTDSLARRLVREILDPEPGEGPSLTLQNGPREGERHLLPEPPTRLRLGRGEGCEIVVDDEDASREHAVLSVDLDGVVVEDLGSKNGITVNGRPCRTRRLEDRDELGVGRTVLLFEDPAAAALEALADAEDLETEVPTLAEPEAPEEPARASDEPDDDEPEEPEVAEAPAPLSSGDARAQNLDAIIYVLAGAVLAASLLGLFWVLRG